MSGPEAPAVPADRYRRPSPRTAERPMAFTGPEFVRGAFAAWGLFNGLAPLVLAGSGVVAELAAGRPTGAGWAPLVLLLAPMFLVPWSLGSLLLVGAPLALAIGLGLARIPRRSIHLAAFACLGALVGALTTMAYVWFSTLPQPGTVYSTPRPTLAEQLADQWLLVLLFAAGTALAVVLGWRWTAMRALRADTAAGHPLRAR